MMNSKSCKLKSSTESVKRAKTARQDISESSRSQESTPGEFDLPIIDRDDSSRFRYGWGSYTPDKLQFLKKPVWLLGAMCFTFFVQSFGFEGVFPASYSQIKMRFHLTHDDQIMMKTLHYVSAVAALGPMAFFASHTRHKARLIGIGALFMAAGCILVCVPHFYTNHHGHFLDEHRRCTKLIDGTSDEWCDDRMGMNSHRTLFVFGNLLFGLGRVPTYSIGLAFLDEHVPHHTSVLYTGLCAVANSAGSLAGHLMADAFWRINGDMDKFYSKEKRKDFDDPEYYGAWWLGMLMCTVLCLFAAVFIGGFPVQMGSTTEALARDYMEEHRIGNRKKPWMIDIGDNICDFVKRSSYLFRQPVFLLLILEQSCSYFVLAGFSNKLSEHFIVQFSSTPIEANRYAVICTTIGAILGFSIGIFCQVKLQLGIMGNLNFSLAASIGFFICSFAYLIQCPAMNIAGLTTPYINETTIGNLTADCNSDCHCLDEWDHTMCYKEDDRWLAFFSPCHAGCTIMDNTAGMNCACVPGSQIVSAEACSGSCNHKQIKAFLLAMCWCLAFVLMRRNANLQATLRFVPFTYRIAALAISDMIAHIFGPALSAPAIGFLVKAVCRRWQYLCGIQEHCTIYDRKKFAIGMTGMTAAVGLTGAVAMYMAARYYAIIQKSMLLTVKSSKTRSKKTAV